MSIIIPTPHGFPEPQRTTSVELGSQNYISVIWRLTRMELYKLRRRGYSQIVLLVLFGLVIIFTAGIGFEAVTQANTPAASLVPPPCSANNNVSNCTDRAYSQAQLEKNKEDMMHGFARALGLPDSFTVITQVLSVSLIAPLGIMLLGLIMGAEYSSGIVRLLFTRGPMRLQCLLAKIIASLTYTTVVVFLLIATYIIAGMLAYPLTGEPYSYALGFFHAADFGTTFSNSLLLGLIAIGYWFFYGMLALFFGTIGRSTAAAIGGASGWFILEVLLSKALGAIQILVPAGPVHDLAKTIPDYLPGTNFYALSQNRLHFISSGTILPTSQSDTHALIIIGIYLILLIGASCLIAMRQEITN